MSEMKFGPRLNAHPGLAAALSTGLAALLLQACASAPQPSKLQQDAVAANERAAHAFQQGRLDQARALFEQALKIDLSIENADGAAINLLSLARVEQAANKPAASHAYLDRVLAATPRFPVDRQAEAAARKAQLYLAAGDLPKAADSAGRAESLCQEGRCSAMLAILNLRAMEALKSGDPERALVYSQRAVSAAPGESGRAERANGLRVSAEARLARKEPEAALQAVGEALTLDQALGYPSRIFRDLMLLGQSAELLGRREEARSYYQRAFTVGSASEDAAAQDQARAQLERP